MGHDSCNNITSMSVFTLLQRGVSRLSTHNKKLQILMQKCRFVSNIQVHDSAKFLTSVLSGRERGAIFAGTGQYHDLKEEQERVVLLNIDEEFLTELEASLFFTTSVLDCYAKNTDVRLMDAVNSSSHLPVFNGELDFINSSDWEYGYTMEPFSIFSFDERICLISDHLIHISVDGCSDVIQLNEVDSVAIWLSEEPYNIRRLFLGLKNKETKQLMCIEKEDEDCNLATLTLETEWMMKAAALLCVHLIKRGNKEVRLRVSPALNPSNNKWVEMRQKVWIEMIRRIHGINE